MTNAPVNDRPAAAAAPDGQAKWSSGRGPWILFFALVVAPLYVMAVTVCIRSGLFHFSGATLSSDQYKALWTFIAAGLAAAATTLGGVITMSQNARNLAVQAAADAKKELLEEDTNQRLKLDTVMHGLRTICPGGTYAAKAATAGGLAALVQLGHPIIAMRTLAAAVEDDAVDRNSIAWLLGQVLTTTVTMGTEADLESGREEAASLLRTYVPRLTVLGQPGDFSWPGAVMCTWPDEISQNGAINVIYALAELLLSRSQEWWSQEGSFEWIILTLEEAFLAETNPVTRAHAVLVARLMLNVTEATELSGVLQTRSRADVEATFAGMDQGEPPAKLAARFTAWKEGGPGSADVERSNVPGGVTTVVG